MLHRLFVPSGCLLLFVVACSESGATDPAQSTPSGGGGGDAAGGTGSEGGAGGEANLDIPVGGMGGRSLVAPDYCEPRIYLDDSSCSSGSDVGVSQRCLTWEELNDPCSPIQLRALSSDATGSGSPPRLSDPTSADQCPDYEDLVFGTLGPACGATQFTPVCSAPIEMDDGACCYAVMMLTNAC